MLASLCRALTWINPRYTFVPSFLNLPPTSHPIPPSVLQTFYCGHFQTQSNIMNVHIAITKFHGFHYFLALFRYFWLLCRHGFPPVRRGWGMLLLIVVGGLLIVVASCGVRTVGVQVKQWWYTGLTCSTACGILLGRGLNSCPFIGRWIPNHWGTREVPLTLFYLTFLTLGKSP